MQMLVTLRQSLKTLPASDIDAWISAELPDKDADPVYYDRVTSLMLHGKCGAEDPNCPCMRPDADTKELRWKAHYPRRLRDHTPWGENSYLLYRRRDNGRTFTKYVRGRFRTFNNGDVVPHNRYLLMKYNAHINVEVASNFRCCKYIYKYIYKGEDRATAKVTEVDAELPAGSNTAAAADGSRVAALASDAQRRAGEQRGCAKAPPDSEVR